MKRLAAFALASALFFAAMPPASASDSDYRRLDPQTEQAIRDRLTEQGYDVRRIKTEDDMEDDMYEAYAIKDGKRLEIYLNDKLEIIREKRDD